MVLHSITVAMGPLLGVGNIVYVCVCVWARAGYEETSGQLSRYLFALAWNVWFKQTLSWVQVQFGLCAQVCTFCLSKLWVVLS